MNKKIFYLFLSIILFFGVITLVSAANSDGVLQIWRNATTGANVTTINNNGDIYSIGNLTIEGNVSSSTGFFDYLGSLVNRINSLFVKDINASGNIDVAGNVSAFNFFGDGSGLTNLNVSNIDLSGFVPYTGANNFTVNTNSLFVNKENGKIGIRTTTPQEKLDVQNGGEYLFRIK